MSALKLFSILLDYPRDELWLNREELLEAADGVQLSKSRRSQLKAFVTELLEQPPMAAQEAWLGLFDRGRAMSLLLFEHIHGESRDRGQAMVDLDADLSGQWFRAVCQGTAGLSALDAGVSVAATGCGSGGLALAYRPYH